MIRIRLHETLANDQSSDSTFHFLLAMPISDSFVDTNLEAVRGKRL
jgi:hypothetical protein